MFNILIVDNHILFREGLTNLLQKEPGICVVGEASSIFEAVEKARLTSPDLVLVDANLSDIEEYNGIRLLKSILPKMQVVLMSTHESGDLLIYAIRNGARGYLPKNHSMNRFMASIRALERGEAVIPRSMVGRLVDEFSRLATPNEQDGLGILTPREIEVLCELGQGRSNREIAELLDIAENTVKVHVHNILDKLNLRNRRQAARFARYQGITSQRLPKNTFGASASKLL